MKKKIHSHNNLKGNQTICLSKVFAFVLW